MKKFNPKDWINNPKPTPPSADTSPAIEKYIQAIEHTSTDITGNYTTWRDIGFALAQEHGESGRDYFHRISRFHPSYNQKECDAQFTNCLKANGSGIGIATFYHHAKQNGITPLAPEPVLARNAPPPPPLPPANNDDDDPEEELNEQMPVFPDEIYAKLPIFLQKVVAPATSPEERDILLLGSLTTLSACLRKVSGIYRDTKVYPNLYLFVTAPASAGKGRLSLCKTLVLPIHKLMRERAKDLRLQYANDLADFNANKGQNEKQDKPARPPERMLIIPANNSNTGVFQLLFDNKGFGLIFETEGDTLTQSLRSEHGNFSDGLRKAYHHETISYYRRTDKEYVDIETPCLSTVLSGTPRQVISLVPSAEDGLFSRFMFYYMNLKPEWQNVFAKNVYGGINEYYLNLGEQFLELYKTLTHNGPINFVLTEEQENNFNAFFGKAQAKYLAIQPEVFVASVRRLGLSSFRIGMILSILRIMEDGDVSPTRELEDEDFETIITMAEVLLKHSSKVFSSLPEEAVLPKKSNRKERFLESLPPNFDRPAFSNIAAKLKIPQKTAEKYITEFVKKNLIHRNTYGKYTNSSGRSTPVPNSPTDPKAFPQPLESSGSSGSSNPIPDPVPAGHNLGSPQFPTGGSAHTPPGSMGRSRPAHPTNPISPKTENGEIEKLEKLEKDPDQSSSNSPNSSNSS